MANIDIHYPLRPCYMTRSFREGTKVKALFHCWVHESNVIPPSPLKGGHAGGVVATTLGLVELEDGSVVKVYPEDIQFLDSKFDEYSFPEVNENEQHQP